MMRERLSEESIAMRVVRELRAGDYVNLGFGIPVKCAMFLVGDKDVYFHAEQGVIGYTKTLHAEEMHRADLDYVDAGGGFLDLPSPGMSLFDFATSAAIMVGGHLDCTVLGALEVSEKGDLANWSRGPTHTGGIGGSMDLAAGAKKVIVAMTHTDKLGRPKILKECRLPLTAKECVDLIVTDVAVIEVTRDGLVLKELLPEWTVDEVQALTEPRLIVADDLKEMTLL